MTNIPKIVIVTGSRHAKLNDKIFEVLDQLDPDLLVQGGALGVDKIAKKWCLENGVACCEVPADWSLGKRGGPLRNGKMLWLYPTAVVAAFPCIKSVGTWNCVKQAKEANHEILVTRLGGRWS